MLAAGRRGHLSISNSWGKTHQLVCSGRQRRLAKYLTTSVVDVSLQECPCRLFNQCHPWVVFLFHGVLPGWYWPGLGRVIVYVRGDGLMCLYR